MPLKSAGRQPPRKKKRETSATQRHRAHERGIEARQSSTTGYPSGGGRDTVRVPPDTEGRFRGIGAAYYNRTGRLPGVDKTLALTDAVKDLPLRTQQDYDDLFPPYIVEMVDEDDLTIPQFIATKTDIPMEQRATWDPQRHHTHGLEFKSDEEAAASRMLPQPEEYKGVPDPSKINPRAWVSEQLRMKLSPEAGEALLHSSADDQRNAEALGMTGKEYERAGMAGSDFMNPVTLAAFRKIYLGKEQKDLTREQRQDLQKFGLLLSKLYDDSDGYAAHYGNDLRNIKWDKFMDNLVTRLVLFGNLAHAIIPPKTEKAKLQRELAMKTIEWASYGKIQADDAIYEVIKAVGVTGDPDSPLSPQQQYADLLFSSYADARSDMTQYQNVFRYANDFGPSYLPDELRQFYEAGLKEFFTDPIAAADAEMGIPVGVLAEAKENGYSESLTKLLFGFAVQGQGRSEEEAAAAWEEVQPLLYEGEAQEELIKKERYGRKPTTTRTNVWGDETVIPTGKVDATKWTEGEEKTAFVAQQESAAGKLSPSDQEALTVLVPAMLDIEERLYSGEPNALVKVLDDYERLANRLSIAALIYDRIGSGMKDPFDLEEEAPTSTHLKNAQRVLSAAPGRMDIVYRDIIDILSNLDDVKAAWEASGNLDDEPDSYMDALWKSTGWERESHPEWFWISAMGWSLAKDAWMDAVGVGAFGIGRVGSRALAFKLLKPKAQARLLEARRLLKGAKAGAELERGEGGHMVLTEATKGAIARARVEVARLENPRWYEPVAYGLAKGEQSGPAIKTAFNITLAGDTEVTDKRAIKAIIDRIGRSRDQDEIVRLFTELRVNHAVDHMDPGASFGKRANLLIEAQRGRLRGSAVRTPFTRTGSLDIDLVDMEDLVYQHAGLTTAGFAPTKEGRASAAALTREFRERAWRLIDTATDTPNYRKEVQDLWDEYQKGMAVQGNKTKATKGSQRVGRHIAKMAGLEGMPTETSMDLYLLGKRLRAGGRRGGGMGKAKGAVYDPQQEYDEVGGVVSIVERSKAPRANTRLGQLRDEAKKVKVLLDDAKKGLQEGTVLKEDAVRLQNDYDNLVAEAKVEKEMGGSFTTPFLEGQLAEYFPIRIDPLAYAAVNAADWRTFFELAQSVGVLHGVGPSLTQMTALFRFAALTRIGFPFTALGLDEFFRPENVRGLVNRVINRTEFKQVRGELRASGKLVRGDAEGLTGIFRNESSTGWIPVGPEHPDYALHLNNKIAQLNERRMVDGGFIETGMETLAANPKLPNETVEAYFKRYKEELLKRVNEDGPAGELTRLHLTQQHRMEMGGYVPEAERAAVNKARQEVVDETNRLIKDLTAQRKLLKERAEATEARVAEARRAEGFKSGKIGDPRASYKARWLKERYGDEGLETTAKVSALRPGRLRHRAKAEPVEVIPETDKDVIARLGHHLDEKDVKAALKRDWEDSEVSRLLGDTEAGVARREAKDQAKDLAAKLKEARSANFHGKQLAHSEYGGVTDAVDDWADEWVEHIGLYMEDDTLYEALTTGRKLSKDEVKRIVASAEERKRPLPVAVAANPRGKAEITIPLFSALAEKRGIGPYWLLEKISNYVRDGTFVDAFTRRFDELTALGFEQKRAASKALVWAKKYTDSASYVHNMYLSEYQARNLALFVPAYRQATKYWVKLAMKHPLVSANILNNYQTEFPAVTIGGYRFQLPIPFWLTLAGGAAGINDLLPGLSPLFIIPARTVGFATGWTEREDGSYEYTGAEKMDEIAKWPLMGYAGRNSSPTFEIDDLLYAFIPSLVTPDPSSKQMILLRSLGMAFFRDPIKRNQLSTNIARAQMSKGMKPDFSGAVDELRQDDWFYHLFTYLTGEAGHPEALMSALTRVANPLGRTVYEPADLGPDLKKGQPFWKSFWGGEPTTMADGYYELSQCYGNKEKMEAVLDRYPKLKTVQEFYDMDVEERIEFLSDDKNLWVVPYTSGRNDYDGGRPLLGGEYWDMAQRGLVMNKPLHGENGYLASVSGYMINLGWSRTRTKIENDTKSSLVGARKVAMKAIAWASEGNPAYKKALTENFKYWWNQWTDKQPATDDEGKPDEYGNMRRAVLYVIDNYARTHGITDPMLYDVETIKNREYKAYQKMGYTFKEGDKEPQRPTEQGPYKITAAEEGLTDYYVNDFWKSQAEYQDRVGLARRVTDALKSFAKPEYRRLFDLTESQSASVIAEEIKKREQYNNVLIQAIASDAPYKRNNPGTEFRSIGMDVDVFATNMAAQKLQGLYYEYQGKMAKYKEGSEQYLAVRAEYIKERDRIWDGKGGEAFRDGPAGRLLKTYLANGPGGKKPDVRFIKMVQSEMAKENPDYMKIVTWYENNKAGVKALTITEREEARYAWAAICVAGVKYRREMAGLWNESMKARGISPSATSTEHYVARLDYLRKLWAWQSERFAKQWNGLEPDYLINNMLDVGY